jgi:hypothetical protein
MAFNVYWRPAQVDIHCDTVGDLDVHKHGEDRV